MPHQSFEEELVKKFRATSVQSVPLREGVKFEEFDDNEETESWPFRELVGGSMWLAILTRPDISNAVRSVARYCSTPKAIHWKAALGILAYITYFRFWHCISEKYISRYFFRDFCRRRLRQ